VGIQTLLDEGGAKQRSSQAARAPSVDRSLLTINCGTIILQRPEASPKGKFGQSLVKKPQARLKGDGPRMADRLVPSQKERCVRPEFEPVRAVRGSVRIAKPRVRADKSCLKAEMGTRSVDQR